VNYTNNTALTAISSLTVAGNARTRLNQGLAPKGDRFVQVDSGTMASMVTGVAAYFNPSGAVSEQYREGLIARTAMADYYENERIWNATTISSVTMSTAKLNGFISTAGQTSLNVTSITQQVPVGTVFTIANVYDVHMETKGQFPPLKQFVVTSSNSNASTWTVQPPIYLSGARQNVGGAFTATTLAMSNYAITVLGTTTLTAIPTGLMYHKDAFTFATAELPLMMQLGEVRAQDDGRPEPARVAGLGHPQRRAADPDRHALRVRGDSPRVGMQTHRQRQLTRRTT
jgi:hypothetical protein